MEDSSLATDALRILLEEHGYVVSAADSIAAARAASAARSHDVALLDIVLPDGNGLVLAREWSRSGGPVVLALTGHADEETRMVCLDAGCRAVLVKPVSSAELIRQIEAVIS